MTFTFDTGMLIALERRKRAAWDAFRAIVRRGLLPVVPAVVYVEWWRGRSDDREEILDSVLVEGMEPPLCRAAGEALGSIRGATLADAVVMASPATVTARLLGAHDPALSYLSNVRSAGAAMITFSVACSLPGELMDGLNWIVRSQVPVGAMSPEQVEAVTVKSAASAPETP